MSKPPLTSIRHRFGELPTTAHKQLGLRYVRDALALAERNPERVAELHEMAWHHLQYAEAAR